MTMRQKLIDNLQLKSTTGTPETKQRTHVFDILHDNWDVLVCAINAQENE